MFIRVKRNKLFWHYVIMSGNGQILSSSETYFSKGNAMRAAFKLAQSLKLEVKG